MTSKRLIESFFPIRLINQIVSRETFNRKPIYNIHRWWAKRPGSTFRAILLCSFLDENTKKDEFEQMFYQSHSKFSNAVILDPMAGGGTTIVEANRLGFNVVGIDINPVAWFVMKKELDDVDLDLFKNEFNRIQNQVASKIKSYYATNCSHCGKKAEIIHCFWISKKTCSKCEKEGYLFPSFRLTEKQKNGEHIKWVFCPNCRKIFVTKNKIVHCPECDLEFDVSKGNVRRGIYTCRNCGNNQRITNRLENILKKEMFAIEYYCSVCGKRRYKNPDDFDESLFDNVRREFLIKKSKLLFPKQKIPPGKEVNRLFNYNYTHFNQFFNERQLYCLSLILQAILETENDNLKEFLLLAFSDCLDTNNLFARYNQKASKMEPMFAHHAFYPKNMPAENNVWGTKIGRGTFLKCFKKVYKGKEYCKNPYEYKISGKKTEKILISGEKIKGNLVEDFLKLAETENNTILKCQSSETMSFMPNKSVDAVITDPPYYDNIMYSELSNFFYVWLRLGLKKNYKLFENDYVPNISETVVNTKQNKTEKDYFEGLTRIFVECNRVIKDNGFLIFTFHHKKDEAWASVLQAVLDSCFQIISVYPVHSEMKTSFHIYQKKAITYDTVIVCKKAKKVVKKNIEWNKLLSELFEYSKRTVLNILQLHPDATIEDMLVVIKGKCLEIYSKHYPKIVNCDKQVTILDALIEVNTEIIPKIKKIIMKNKNS